MTAGPIERLKNGWALFPLQGSVAHYWIEDTKTMPPEIGEGGRVRYYKSACGKLGAVNSKVPALEPGSWPLCKRCLHQRAATIET